MFTDIIKSFIEEVMGMCLDNNIESNEIPDIIMQMVLKVGDDGDVQKVFDEITQECNIDPYGNAVNQLEIYEVVYNDMANYLQRETDSATYKYQDVGLSYGDALNRAKGTIYIKHLENIVKAIDDLIEEFKEEYDYI